MEEVEVLNRLQRIEDLVDPQEINILSHELNNYLIHYENDLHERNLQVSNEWLRIREVLKSNAQADKVLETRNLYRDREKCKLKIAQMKRLRSDLKSRLEILMNIKRF